MRGDVVASSPRHDQTTRWSGDLASDDAVEERLERHDVEIPTVDVLSGSGSDGSSVEYRPDRVDEQRPRPT